MALRAAWDPDDILAAAPGGMPPISHERAREKVNRFVGFFEGRVGVAPPSWWTLGLECDTGDVTRAGHPAAMQELEASFTVPWSGKNVARIYYSSPSPTVITSHQRDIEISQGGRRLRLPMTLFKQLDAYQDWTHAPESTVLYPVFRGDDCYLFSYVAFQEGDIQVLRIRMSDGKVLWKTVGWGNAGRTRVGQAGQRAIIEVDDAGVNLFGEGTFGMFAETLALSNGRAKYRFNTTGYRSFQTKDREF